MTELTKVEQMCKDLGCTGKRVTSELINSHIEAVEYKEIELCGTRFMYCGIKMKNGFVVVGSPSVCTDPNNWRDEIAKAVSYDHSFGDIWSLEAYAMMGKD